GGKSLHQLQKVCGLPGPDGSIQAFTPHDEEEGSYFGDPTTEDPGPSVSGGGSRKWTVIVYIMAALVGILVSYVTSATLIVRKVEGLWRLPFGGGVFEALCEGAAQCWRGFRRRCCCCCSCCFRGDDGSPGDGQRPDFSERKLYGYTSAAGEGRRLIFPARGDAEETRRGRRGRSRGSSRGGGGGGDGGGPRSSSPTRHTASTFYEDEEASRPRARSDSSGSGGASGDFYDGERLFGAAGAGSSASGRAGAGGRRGNGYGAADGRGVAPSAGGAGRELLRPVGTARRKRGGGVQILSTSAVDAAAAAAKLAEEIANDDEV
ncbi:unnamed protein product, partial [Ectocarpus sp. 6 AP-2014]